MNTKKKISEKEACKIFLAELINATEEGIKSLKDIMHISFQDINCAKAYFFCASLYCATLPMDKFFVVEQAERIRQLITSFFYTFEFFQIKGLEFVEIMVELEKAYQEWDEPLYKPSPAHPLEGVARYFYRKSEIPMRTKKFGENNIITPNLFIVYAIEAMLITVADAWKHIADNYVIENNN